MIYGDKTFIGIKSDNIDGKGRIEIHSLISIKKVGLKVSISGTDYFFDFENCGSSDFSGEFKIVCPKLWSVSAPNLYTFSASVTYADKVENYCGTFGFRTITAENGKLLLNGKPFYIRGYIRGAKAHDHANNCNLTQKDFYRKNIMAAKKYGFNFIRFHSVVPDEALFAAADELGMLIHIELRSPKDEYNNLEEMLYEKKDLVSDEFITATVLRLFSHPSLAVYCIGNEIKNVGNNPRVAEISRLIKSLDSSRLFIDTCAHGEYDRKGVDIDVQHMSYFFPYNGHSDMYKNTDNLLCYGSASGKAMKRVGVNSEVCRSVAYGVPVIAHEVCHYTALRDYDKLKQKFACSGVEAPWWIDEELKMISVKGYSGCFEKMYKASKYFQFECWKTALEALRASDFLSGFHFLQFADTDVYENSNGVVDCFDDDNGVDCREFSLFNADTVILAKLSSRLFYENEKITVPIMFSDYSDCERISADFYYQLSDCQNKVCSGKLENVDISRKGLYNICKLTLNLPSVNCGKQFLLSVKLCASGSAESDFTVENRWKIWVYPKQDNSLSYAEFCSYQKDSVTVTDDMEKAIAELSLGGRVCLIYRSEWTRHLLNKQMQPPKYAFKATWNRFKPVIWDRGTNYGGLCDEKILSDYGFGKGGYYDFNYAKISEDCDKIILDDFPCKVKTIVSGIDKSVRDRFDAYSVGFNLPQLQYDRTLRNFGYLFELKVGGGKLLVCGLNLTGIDSDEPSSVAMEQFILKYISSNDFSPENGVSVSQFTDYLASCAKEPVKERMMTQFWELDDEPVESKQYWTSSREYITEK